MGATQCTLCAEDAPLNIRKSNAFDYVIVSDEDTDADPLSRELQMLRNVAHFLITVGSSTRAVIWKGMTFTTGEEMVQELLFDCARAYMKSIDSDTSLLYSEPVKRRVVDASHVIFMTHHPLNRIKFEGDDHYFADIILSYVETSTSLMSERTTPTFEEREEEKVSESGNGMTPYDRNGVHPNDVIDANSSEMTMESSLPQNIPTNHVAVTLSETEKETVSMVTTHPRTDISISTRSDTDSMPLPMLTIPIPIAGKHLTDNNSNTRQRAMDKNGDINWKKVADFSLLLRSGVKDKIWRQMHSKGMHINAPTDGDCNDVMQSEVDQIAFILEKVVMLQLTSKYKKSKSTVPENVSRSLSNAVRAPSSYICQVLKCEESNLKEMMQQIHVLIAGLIRERYQGIKDGAEKCEKRLKTAKQGYRELMEHGVGSQFNRDDFMKMAYVQYLIYAYWKRTELRVTTKVKGDYTLDGLISWKSVADFTCLLDRDTRLKVWDGATEAQEEPLSEIGMITNVLQTVVMIKLTSVCSKVALSHSPFVKVFFSKQCWQSLSQVKMCHATVCQEFKKTFPKAGDTMPEEMMKDIPEAMLYPAEFVANFLKRNDEEKRDSLSGIYKKYCDDNERRRSVTEKTDKYQRKMELAKEHYQELVDEEWQTEFNQNDFLKAAYLQYLLRAFEAEMQQR